MSEKEIKKTDVAGKKIEDLTEEELEAVQGAGSEDVNGETISIGISVVTGAVSMTIALSKKVCGKK